jgi:hypothetical protein
MSMRWSLPMGARDNLKSPLTTELRVAALVPWPESAG